MPLLARRDILRAGTLGLLGLPGLGSRVASAAGGGSGFGQAKRCIFLFMWGGPSQLDTFDLKPEAPAEVRGEFQPISTSVPDLFIGEHFRHMAPMMDRVALVRSLTHDDPAHLSSAHYILTGHLAPVVRSDAEPPSDRDTPHIGSVVHHLRGSRAGMPGFVTMPWLAYHPAAPGGRAPGQNGGWTGRKYDPLLVEGDPSQPDWNVPALTLQDGLTAARLNDRRHLLRTVDKQRAELDSLATRSLTEQQRQAFDLLSTPNVRRAFDLTQEDDATRERYGRNIHGQCVLLARRLVEHGVPLVSVNWHNDGHNFWDTHGNNFNRLKNDLIPPSDQALAALLRDLEQRGLLEDTIVAWVGEFGRRPQITSGNAGREHWPQCFSGLFAGGGIRGGTVYGASDAQAAYPDHSPVSPADYVATLYHALGVASEDAIVDRTDRPHRVYGGTPLLPLFG